MGWVGCTLIGIVMREGQIGRGQGQAEEGLGKWCEKEVEVFEKFEGKEGFNSRSGWPVRKQYHCYFA